MSRLKAVRLAGDGGGAEALGVRFNCANCALAGTYTWQVSSTKLGAQTRTLTSLSSGFHMELGRTASGEPMVVCDTCDEIHFL
jgi:hypothetical protein